MTSRPVILLVQTMHESGLRLLREAGELRLASGTDPASLRHDVVGAEALIVRTGGVIDAFTAGPGQGLEGRRPARRGL